MNNKKIVFIISLLLVLFIAGCQMGVDEYSTTEAYIDGQKDAIYQIEGSISSKTYVDFDIIEEIILNQYDDDTRDMILYHPDVEIYTEREIVGGLIDGVELGY